jgi:hypothetical protein
MNNKWDQLTGIDHKFPSSGLHVWGIEDRWPFRSSSSSLVALDSNKKREKPVPSSVDLYNEPLTFFILHLNQDHQVKVNANLVQSCQLLLSVAFF